MAFELVQSGPDLLTLTIHGLISQPEFAKAQKLAIELISGQKTIRVLVNAERLAGFAREGDWNDMSIRAFDRHIARMAIIGDPAWKDLIFLFTGKGLRRFPIEFFAPPDAAKARAWLDQPSEAPRD